MGLDVVVGEVDSRDTTPALGGPISSGGVAVGTTSTTVVAANTNRTMIELFNPSDVGMYVQPGNTSPQAVVGQSIYLAPNGGSYSQVTTTGFAAIVTGATGGKTITWVEW